MARPVNRSDDEALLEAPLEHEFRVIGPPGCGKTTWIGREVGRSVDRGESVLVASFTRAAADEVAGRVPVPTDQVGTLHSFCFRVLDKPEIALDKQILRDWNTRYPFYEITPVNADFTEPVHGHALEGANPLLRGDRLLSQYEMYRATMTTERMPPAVRHFAARWTHWKWHNGLLDFTDLIEECLQNAPVGPGNPQVIFIDEAQDLSPIELRLVRKWGRQAQRLILVGDPDQTIYTWRGATDRTMSHPVSDEQRLVLTQSYRVPHEIHAQAVPWINRVPTRERVAYWPRPAKGKLARSRAIWKNPQTAVDEAEIYLDEGKEVMFLSSCAYMLKPLLKQLRQRGIPYHNSYRRSNREWNPLLRLRVTSMADRVRAYVHLSHRGTWSPEEILMWTWAFNPNCVLRPGATELIERLIGDKIHNVSWETMVQLLTDDAIEAGHRGDLAWFGQHIRPDQRRAAEYPLAVVMREGPKAIFETPKLTVGTIHSVKGGEADTVLLFPDLSGSGMKDWYGRSTTRPAIFRLFYVGMTRARETLVLLSPGGRNAVRF